MNLLKLFKRKRKADIMVAESGPGEFMGMPVFDIAITYPEPVHKTGPVKTKPKQFVPGEHRTGGRIVKTMPAQLRHMKEIADKTDD